MATEIIYNNETIASLNEGETATLPCANMLMSGDVSVAAGFSSVQSVNGQTGEVQLDAADVNAAATTHSQPASTITAGTFAGQVVANSNGQIYNTSLLRNSKLVDKDTNPTVNGEICWTYK